MPAAEVGEAWALPEHVLGTEGRPEGEYTEIKASIAALRCSMWKWKKVRMEKNQLLLEEQTREILNYSAILKYLFLSKFSFLSSTKQEIWS